MNEYPNAGPSDQGMNSKLDKMKSTILAHENNNVQNRAIIFIDAQSAGFSHCLVKILSKNSKKNKQTTKKKTNPDFLSFQPTAQNQKTRLLQL